ncbi:hypothetical protein [Streptomyces sp. NPDC047043]|uniref:hypothetical protein n=1 Tax=Streptomyces sp. NPDC047043 TaxID=3154497 RepID=UPI0033DAB1F9
MNGKRTGSWASGLGRKMPFWASRKERGHWEQKELLLARIAELDAVLHALETRALEDSERSALAPYYAEKARAELEAATKTLEHEAHPMMRGASHTGVAQSHVDAALNLMVWLASLDDVKALLPQMVALVDEHFTSTDPRRERITEIAGKLDDPHNSKLAPSDRAFLAETVSLARRLLRKETLRVRSFVRIVMVVSVCLTVAAVGLAIAGYLWQEMVPLCFTPEVHNTFQVVCPTRARPAGKTMPSTEFIARTAREGDYLVVEIVGVVSAGIASAAALRRIRGTSLPYNVPVVLALLKLPTGALTAVLGLLLMRGGFIPGLSALDSTAQIIAWAVVFGYSQQLFTKSVDSQGQAVLDAVRGPGLPAPSVDDGKP